MACQLTKYFCITALWENTPKRGLRNACGTFQITRPAREEGRFLGGHGSPELPPGAARLAARSVKPNR